MENYKTLEDFEKQEFENAKHDGIDIEDYEDAILQTASDKYWDWVYNNHLEADSVNDIMNILYEENEQLKNQIKNLEQLNAKYLKDLIYYEETYKAQEVGSEYLGGV